MQRALLIRPVALRLYPAVPLPTIVTRPYASKKKSSKQTSEPPPRKTASKGHDMLAEEVEGFSMQKMEGHMKDHIERLRVNLKSVVGRVQGVSAGGSTFRPKELCERLTVV